jgi:hypothetical protein
MTKAGHVTAFLLSVKLTERSADTKTMPVTTSKGLEK